MLRISKNTIQHLYASQREELLRNSDQEVRARVEMIVHTYQLVDLKLIRLIVAIVEETGIGYPARGEVDHELLKSNLLSDLEKLRELVPLYPEVADRLGY
ncbi:hypothetical protein Pan97_12210 [Bremerella volcania]|uniref:Uncharacterized protein n=1 Tax=Bremerella volcania TaxID=2527984 RepID=A0A518C4T5_9BACT|nr:hypothetical protein [Bremerella volcania]QDU74216.1 hypothetical protein Pan97_12210 [Bremerella volcania]